MTFPPKQSLSVDKLDPEARKRFAGQWREYVSKIPTTQGVNATYLRLARDYGAGFASEVAAPEISEVQNSTPEPAPVNMRATAEQLQDKSWYNTWPVVSQAWSGIQTGAAPFLKGLELEKNKWITPAAESLTSLVNAEMRQKLGGINAWALPEEQRNKAWEQMHLPWLLKTGVEMGVDPLSYIGWGIPGAVEKAGAKLALKEGTQVLGKVLQTGAKPFVAGERVLERASTLPIKGAAKVLQSTPVAKALIQESKKSIVNSIPVNTFDTMNGLIRAGAIKGKSFSQILQDFMIGAPDQDLLKTITNPDQQKILKMIQSDPKALGIDEALKIADKYPAEAASTIGHKLATVTSAKLGVKPPKLWPGPIGSVQRASTKMYGLWRKMVLQTPYYVVQNAVEDSIRQLLNKTMPSLTMGHWGELKSLNEHPVDIVRRVVSLEDRMNGTIPDRGQMPFARTPATGGATEATMGSLAVGKGTLPSTVSAYLDDAAIVNLYFNKYNLAVNELITKATPATQKAYSDINKAYQDLMGLSKGTTTLNPAQSLFQKFESMDDAGKLQYLQSKAGNPSYYNLGNVDEIYKELFSTGTKNILKPGETWRQRAIDYLNKYQGGVPQALIDPKILEELQKISITGSPDDILEAFQRVQRNKNLDIYSPMSDEENALPFVVIAKLKQDLPRLWAKNDFDGIKRLFDTIKVTYPQRIETYQKQLMVQRMKEYRNLLRQQVPEKYHPFMTKVLNSFRYERASEAEANIIGAKSLTAAQRAMFNVSVESRRELESLMEGTLISAAISGKVDEKVLTSWYGISESINQRAFEEGSALIQNTFNTSNAVRFAKSPTAKQKAWDSFIQSIQSEFPDVADMLIKANPNNDTLWSAYRNIQEKRWFNVGQEKLKAMEIGLGDFPTVVGANGKLLTQEDWIQEQLKALDGWYSRVAQKWDNRHISPSAQDKMMDDLRETVLKAREGTDLEHLRIRNQASDIALAVTHDTFGNYAHRTNLDDIMQGIGVPFWFFPSRSIPFYTKQMIQRPRMGIELVNLQRDKADSEQPNRLFGSLNIPGTNYWYNPLQSTMLWQLADRSNFTPDSIGSLEAGENYLKNMLGVSLGPQWKIATMLVQRVWDKNFAPGEYINAEPQTIIPQQKWLSAVEGLHLPGISQVAGIISEPFDAYLRAVYGEEIAQSQQREVEKYLVDAGFNPADPNLPDVVIQDAWKRYYIRQLASIPLGTMQVLTDSEKARLEAMDKTVEGLNIPKEQLQNLRSNQSSAFIGLRSDQLETLYKDIPEEKLWKNIRPSGLTAKSSPYWNQYVQMRFEKSQLLGDPENLQPGTRLYKESQFDKQLREGKITPSEWKELYRQSYADYSSRIAQIEKDYPLAPKSDEDWVSFQQMIGWSTPVKHPDDIALDQYYKELDSAKFTNDLGEFDYGSYKQAEKEFLSGLSPDTTSYIKSRKDRYKTPLRAAYSRTMESLQPYYDLENLVKSQLDPKTAGILDAAQNAPNDALQRFILQRSPQATLALRKIRILRLQYRRANPSIAQALDYWSG